MCSEPGVEDAGAIGLPVTRRRPRRLSQLFRRLSDESQDRVTLRHILDELGDRSFAALLVLFAALNLLPLPPGGSTVLGLPLVIVAAQLMAGSRRVWLPRYVAEKSLSAEQFRSLMARVIPKLERFEAFVRPRYWPFRRRRGDRVIGAIAFVLAVILMLPIPFANWLPAFSVTLVALALAQRDGIVLGAGVVAGVASIALVAAILGTAGAAAGAVFGWMS
jgi:hypothetical protein